MPAIDFREYSFLANERTPAALKQQRLVVTPDAAAKEASLRTEGGAKVGRGRRWLAGQAGAPVQQRAQVCCSHPPRAPSALTPPTPQALRIPAGLNDEGLRAALAPHAADVQLLHFSSLEGSIAGFAKAEDMSRFNVRACVGCQLGRLAGMQVPCRGVGDGAQPAGP